MKQAYPILEFDEETAAIIEPRAAKAPVAGMPERAVLCFFQDVIDRLQEQGALREIHALRSEMGARPVYAFSHQGREVALAQPGIGAPLAAAHLENLIALGCRKFVACGGAGVLDGAIPMGHLIVPVSAVRDEGTSYHYLPPSREVAAPRDAVAAIERTLAAHNIPYHLAKTWTTDAFYRETPGKVALRKAEGCVAVEMEAAALFAVAAFRHVTLGLILYGGDDVSGADWDHRGWQDNASVREQLVALAMEACFAL
ncbi:MAG: nucleoside phosphorylase [Candidatus Hydrogenedentes bacterium]|nr:nucleoside phosphorylase [Candidatus Hydrogenedentota bacterium]